MKFHHLKAALFQKASMRSLSVHDVHMTGSSPKSACLYTVNENDMNTACSILELQKDITLTDPHNSMRIKILIKSSD